MFWNRGGSADVGLGRATQAPSPPHPRVAAELAAMRELQGARSAMERASALRADATRLLTEATAQLDFARREVRRIAEAKVAP